MNNEVKVEITKEQYDLYYESFSDNVKPTEKAFGRKWWLVEIGRDGYGQYHMLGCYYTIFKTCTPRWEKEDD